MCRLDIKRDNSEVKMKTTTKEQNLEKEIEQHKAISFFELLEVLDFRDDVKYK